MLPLKDEDEETTKKEEAPPPPETVPPPQEEPPKPPPQEDVKTPRGLKASMKARLRKAKVKWKQYYTCP